MSIQAQLWAKEQKGLNSGAKFVLWVLADYADARGASCFPTVESIAEDTAQGYRTVLRHLDELEAMSLIECFRERRDDGTLGRYSYALKILPHAKLATGATCQKLQKPHAKLAPLSNDEPPCYPPLHTHTEARVRAVDVLENVKGFALDLGFSESEILPELESIDTLWDAQGTSVVRSADQTAAQVRRLLRHQAQRLRKRPKPIASGDAIGNTAADEAPKPSFAETVRDQDRATWLSVCAGFPKGVYRAWIAPCTLTEVQPDQITIAAPSAFHRDHMTTHHELEIQKLWAAQTGRNVRVRIGHFKPTTTNQGEKHHEFA